MSRLFYVPFTGEPLQLSEQQRIDLIEIAQSRSLPAGFVFRAKLIVMLADGTAFCNHQGTLADNRANHIAPADVIGLYLNPPQHAAVFCVDEKTAIQALNRLGPCCRCLPVVPSVTGSKITAQINLLGDSGRNHYLASYRSEY